jgi:CIC family chloride channel protein
MHKRDYAQSLTSLGRGLSDNTAAIVQTGVTSLAAALSSVAFLVLTNLLFNVTFTAFATHSKLFFVVASFLTIISTSAAVGALLQAFGPEAAGSGIPQVKAAYWKDLGYMPIRIAIVKFVAGVLSIGGGTSLGREGPTVQIGAALSSRLSGFMGSSKRQRRGPVVVGASASLSAAFNTPLASITFVLEEIMGDMSSRNIGRVVISSVLGAFTVYALVG